jgi:hypothetical protein
MQHLPSCYFLCYDHALHCCSGISLLARWLSSAFFQY